MPMPICDCIVAECGYKVTQLVHTSDSLTCELQALNTEQKQAVDEITDRKV